jgi:ATP-dependent DNA ligase
MCLPTSRASGGNSPPLSITGGCEDLSADILFRHACKLGLDGIVSKRLGSRYRSGRSPDWLKMKNPDAPP